MLLEQLGGGKVDAHMRKAETLQQTLMTPKGTTNKQRGTNPH